MLIENMTPQQAGLALTIYDEFGADVCAEFIALADDDGWEDVCTAFVWDRSYRGDLFWDKVDERMREVLADA